MLATLKKFNIYQKSRFPVIILSLSFLPAILSTAVIVAKDVSIFQIIGGLIASILYLLHVRIIDEKRDFLHDNKYHKSRPVQAGIITMSELQIMDIYAVIILLIIAISAGVYPALLVLIMLAYSFIASKEFFLGKKLRQHFFIYNFLNTTQTFILQLFIYAFFAGYIPITTIVIIHFIFTSVGTIVFEFVRKVKIPGKDGIGKDTYTWHLGFSNSIIIYLGLALLVVFTFLQIITMIVDQNIFWFFLSAVILGIILLSALIHLKTKSIRTELLMKLSFVIAYAIFNLTIYYMSI